MRRTIALDASPVLLAGVDAPDSATLKEITAHLMAHWHLAGDSWRLEVLGYEASGERLDPRAEWSSLGARTLVLTRAPVASTGRTDLSLVVLTGPDSGRTFPVGAGLWRIGRGGGHDICLDDPLVSRRGLPLEISARGVQVESRFHRLGDVIGVGASTLQVVSARAQAAAPEPWTIRPPTPPRPAEPRRFFLAGIAAPIIVAVVLAVVTKMWLFLLVAAASPLTGFLTWWFERRRARRTNAAEDEAWRVRDAQALQRVRVGVESFRLRSYRGPGCLVGIGSVRTTVTVDGSWPTAPAEWLAPDEGRHWQPVTSGAAIILDPREADIVIRGDPLGVLASARHVLARVRPVRWELASARVEDFSFLAPYGLAHVDAAGPISEGAIRLVDVLEDGERELTLLAPSRATSTRPRVHLDLGRTAPVGVEPGHLDASGPVGVVSGPVAIGAMSVTAWLAQKGAASARATGAGCVPSALESLLPLGPSDLRERWAAADGGARAVIGLTADGPARIDLVRQGPHALVGGTTGSGKSQFLETLAVALAAAHPPNDLTLLLVDFKGGAAFSRISGLPHVAGMLTNLDAHATERAIRALGAELHRRQRLFASRGAKDLDDFRSAHRAESPPRLVIMVDEFRALAQGLPHLMEQLVALSGLGRSLGMHLVLATQRPAGVVTADMRANVGLRIALRMRDAGDSLDVLESTVAAGIPAADPGRGYFRSDAQAEKEFHAGLVQGGEGEATTRVRIGPADGHRAESVTAGTAFSVESFLTAADGHRATPLWLPELPDSLPPDPARPWGAACADIPEQQKQELLDLSHTAHTALIGSPRSGRSRALATLLRSSAHRRPESSWYVVDIDRQLGGLAEHDQCASLMTGDEPWRIDRLLAFLGQEVRRRLEAGCSSPAVDVAIDGWDAFVGLAEEARRDWVNQVVTLARSGAACGLRLLVTGDRKVMASRLGHSLGTVLIFHHHDPQDVVFLGLPKSALPHRMPPGRALLTGSLAGAPLEAPLLVQLVTEEGIPPARDSTPRAVMRALPRAPRRPPTAGRDGAPASIGLGIGGDLGEPMAWRPDVEGSTLLVLAPAGSPYLGDYWRHAAPAAALIDLSAATRADQVDILGRLRGRADGAGGPGGDGNSGGRAGAETAAPTGSAGGPERPTILTAPLDSLIGGSPLLADLNHRGPRLLLGASTGLQGEPVGRRDLPALARTPGLGWYLRGSEAQPLQLYA